MTDRTLTARREELRTAGRRARAAIGEAARAGATAAIVARLLGLAVVTSAERVMLTAAFGDELDLTDLREHLQARGTTVALPVVDGDALVPIDLHEDTEFRAGWQGIPEPIGPATTEPIDTVVVPGLALDRAGDRLGYGGGYYDRFLSGPAATATTIGAVFHAQLVGQVPTEPHDVTLDMVVTEAGLWRSGSVVT